MPVRGALSPAAYDLTGDGIWIAYFPEGFGPVPSAAAVRLLYRDAYGTRTFGARELETTAVAELGTVITVVLDRTPEMTETLSLILPDTEPEATGLPASLRTVAVTAVRRASGRPSGHLPREMYAVTALTGQALSGLAGADTHHSRKTALPRETDLTALLPALLAAALGSERRTEARLDAGTASAGSTGPAQRGPTR